MYLQQFLFYLWEEKVSEFSIDTVDEIELRILQSSQNEFLNLWDSLTLNQKKTLKLILLTGGREMFYANALQFHRFPPSAPEAPLVPSGRQ